MVSSREYEELADLRARFTAAENTLGSHATRITTLEGEEEPVPPPPPPPNTPGVVSYTRDTTSIFNNPGIGRQESFESDGDSGTLDVSGYDWTTLRRYWWYPLNDAPLPQWYLDGVADDCDHAAANGKLLDGKFASAGPGDFQLPKWRIDEHINQLLPIIADKHYVFRQFEMGFFGPWGEFHGISSAGWTDGAGYGNGPHPQAMAMFQNIANQTPSTLHIALRYPTITKWMFENGLSGAHQARAAAYNDMFLASEWSGGSLVAHEGGTFSEAWGDGVGWEIREWYHNFAMTHPARAEADTNPAGIMDWANQGDNALYHGFQRQHIDNLREWGIINQVLIPRGIWDRVQREMGYRIHMRQARIPTTAPDNTQLVFDVEFENTGFAPPRRAYVAKVKFGTSANTASAAWVTATMNSVNVDANNTPTTTGAACTTKDLQGFVSSGQPTTRKWVRFTCTIPTGLSGNYPMSLAFIDPNAELQGNVEYNIRFANTGTWDGANGRNSLVHALAVT